MTKQQRAPEPTTFSRFAASDADTLIGGRFGAIDQNKVIVGSTARPNYPPAAAHQTDPTGIEPPISFMDMTAVEPVGTAQEIEQSLGEPRPGADLSPPGSLGHGSPSGETRSADSTASKRARRSFPKRK